MATIKLSFFDDFLHFLGFSCYYPRGSGAGAPDMGKVMHWNDHLVNPYHFQKKILEKNNFRYHGNHKTVHFWWFSLFFRIFLLPAQGFRGGSPWDGWCNAPKWPSSQSLSFSKEKNNFRYHGNDKTVHFWWFSLFFRIFLLPPQGFGAGTPDMGHVIHQNDHLVMLYHIQKKKLENNSGALVRRLLCLILDGVTRIYSSWTL